MEPRSPAPPSAVDCFAWLALVAARRLRPWVVTPVRVAVVPAQLAGWAVRDVANVIGAPGRAAAKHVRTATDRALGFMEHAVLARIVADMTPHVIEAATPDVLGTVLPQFIDAALPYIRATAVPAIIGDLTTDDRISAMITQQGRSTVAAFSADLRETASNADEHIDAAFRRRFRRAAAR